MKLHISVSQIQFDHFSLNGSVYDLCKYIESGGTIPAIEVCHLPDGNYGIKNGRHRTIAYKLLGITKILAICNPGINHRWGTKSKQNRRGKKLS